MIALFLAVLCNGFSSSSPYGFVKDVTHAVQISAWQGSCVTLKCEYRITLSTFTELTSLAWYKDPVYNISEKKWMGTTVFNQTRAKHESHEPFRNRVEFLGDLKQDCTLLIQELRVEDSGEYGVRLVESPPHTWMAKDPFLSLNVTGSPKNPNIIVPPMITESQPTKVTCSIDYFCQKYPIKLRWQGPVNGNNHTSWKEDTTTLKTTNTLDFVPSWEHDKKVLRCLLSSEKDPQKSSETEITLDVKHSPKFVQVVLEGHSATIKEGESLDLKCHVNSSNPPVTEYNWYKGNAEMDKNGQTLIIKGATKEHAGKYTCEASNSVGKGKSPPMDVIIHFAPKEAKVEIQEDRNIIENQRVTLACSAQCSPPVSDYQWYKDGRSLTQTSSNLVFQRVSPADSGHYHCAAYSPMGNATSPPKHLEVLYAPKRVSMIMTSPDRGWIQENDDVQLVCSYNSSNPNNVSFTWYRNNAQIRGALINAYRMRRITSAWSGQYTCKAENDAGISASSAVMVDVKYAPKEVRLQLYPAMTELREGDSAQISCIVGHSNPYPRGYKWYKDNKPYGAVQNSEIHFVNLNSMDSGYYYCEAVNDISATKSQKVLQLDVLYAPRNVMILMDPSTWIIEESRVTLTCTAEANPVVYQYKWYKVNKLLHTTKDRTLPLDNIKREEAGLYQCEAINKIASKKSEVITLDVHYAPEKVNVLIDSSGLIIEETNVTLTCDADSNPGVSGYTWYNDDIKMQENGKQLLLKSIKMNQSGTFYCEATNHVGTGRSEPNTLTVSYPPKGVMVYIHPSGLITDEIVVTLTCTADANPGIYKYNWYSDKLIENQHRRYLLLKPTDSKAENYHCEAFNRVSSGKSEPITLNIYYSSRTIAKFAAVPVGIVLIIVLIVVSLRFNVWKKFLRQSVATHDETDDRSDTFFVVNKKVRENMYEGLRNAGVSSDAEHEESLHYAALQFPRADPGPEGAELPRALVKNRSSVSLKSNDASAIYSVVRKPCKPTQAPEAIRGYENTTDKAEEDIHYSTLINLKLRPKDLMVECGIESDSEPCNTQYAELNIKSPHS
ncbi:B-cell receptor CD22-like isoform X2 [Ambystoma mexicanum]|uniref:B-cell receptor CD22-like isoform X2 n=1 Tax=Ambystoma mexicanum TaxID=8296 RepID=UPI0037E799E9